MNAGINPEAVVKNFAIEGNVAGVNKLGEGHINDTFLIITDAGTRYVLQCINHQIFKNVPALMHNISRVCEHINRAGRQCGPEKTLVAPEIIADTDGKAFSEDVHGNYWRCMTYIPHQPVEKITTSIACEGGRAIGLFQKILSTLPGERLSDTIPNFHNLRLRLDALHQALVANRSGRSHFAHAQLDALRSRENEMLRLRALEAEGRLPMRTVHNDTKLNNVLFNEEGTAIAIIDLDTVMSGSVLYDFGDAVRTLCNTAREDETNLALVSFNQALFDAFAEGYLMQTSAMLLPVELRHLSFSCRLLPYIMAVRFLTDFLNGDIYFKTNSPMQNLHRASNQIRLMECIENSYPDIEQKINRHSGK